MSSSASSPRARRPAPRSSASRDLSSSGRVLPREGGNARETSPMIESIRPTLSSSSRLFQQPRTMDWLHEPKESGRKHFSSSLPPPAGTTALPPSPSLKVSKTITSALDGDRYSKTPGKSGAKRGSPNLSSYDSPALVARVDALIGKSRLVNEELIKASYLDGYAPENSPGIKLLREEIKEEKKLASTSLSESAFDTVSKALYLHEKSGRLHRALFMGTQSSSEVAELAAEAAEASFQGMEALAAARRIVLVEQLGVDRTESILAKLEKGRSPSGPQQTQSPRAARVERRSKTAKDSAGRDAGSSPSNLPTGPTSPTMARMGMLRTTLRDIVAKPEEQRKAVSQVEAKHRAEIASEAQEFTPRQRLEELRHNLSIMLDETVDEIINNSAEDAVNQDEEDGEDISAMLAAVRDEEQEAGGGDDADITPVEHFDEASGKPYYEIYDKEKKKRRTTWTPVRNAEAGGDPGELDFGTVGGEGGDGARPAETKEFVDEASGKVYYEVNDKVKKQRRTTWTKPVGTKPFDAEGPGAWNEGPGESAPEDATTTRDDSVEYIDESSGQPYYEVSDKAKKSRRTTWTKPNGFRVSFEDEPGTTADAPNEEGERPADSGTESGEAVGASDAVQYLDNTSGRSYYEVNDGAVGGQKRSRRTTWTRPLDLPVAPEEGAEALDQELALNAGGVLESIAEAMSPETEEGGDASPPRREQSPASSPTAQADGGGAVVGDNISPRQTPESERLAPVLSGWAQQYDAEGNAYYYNLASRETRWEEPGNATEGGYWQQLLDEERNAYFFRHTVTGTMRWYLENAANPDEGAGIAPENVQESVTQAEEGNGGAMDVNEIRGVAPALPDGGVSLMQEARVAGLVAGAHEFNIDRVDRDVSKWAKDFDAELSHDRRARQAERLQQSARNASQLKNRMNPAMPSPLKRLQEFRKSLESMVKSNDRLSALGGRRGGLLTSRASLDAQSALQNTKVTAARVTSDPASFTMRLEKHYSPPLPSAKSLRAAAEHEAETRISNLNHRVDNIKATIQRIAEGDAGRGRTDPHSSYEGPRRADPASPVERLREIIEANDRDIGKHRHYRSPDIMAFKSGQFRSRDVRDRDSGDGHARQQDHNSHHYEEPTESFLHMTEDHRDDHHEVDEFARDPNETAHHRKYGY
jgi:hypothetical protein